MNKTYADVSKENKISVLSPEYEKRMSDTDLLQLVMDGMGWEKKKAQRWFNVPNPLLGGATPNGFELMRGKMKLEKFIRQQLDQNKPKVK